MVILIIELIVVLLVELVLFIISSRKKQKRNKLARQSLYKLIEMRVLNRTLSAPISTQQAAQYEYQSDFLRVEFIDSQPWMARIFALDESITIGRSADNMISIRDERLSRCHCRITLQNNGLFLQDMGTKNGTRIRRGFFRNITMYAHQMEEIFDGDRIYIGNYRMKIKIMHGYEAQ